MNIPQVDFYLRENGDWSIKTTKDLMAGKRVVLFLLPGAFTPTCSTQQLPGFEEAYDEIRSYGVDEVFCISVNDAFVMNAWGESLGVSKVKLLPDGNGDFTRGLRAAVEKSNLGFGARAWRCALIVTAEGEVQWAGVEEGQRANASDETATCHPWIRNPQLAADIGLKSL
jgi:peroxiredoxin